MARGKRVWWTCCGYCGSRRIRRYGAKRKAVTAHANGCTVYQAFGPPIGTERPWKVAR